MTTEITFVLKEEDMAVVHINAASLGYSSVDEYLHDALCRGLICDGEIIKMMADTMGETAH